MGESRRQLLARAGCGFGLLALADLLAGELRAQRAQGPDRSAQPFALRTPHYAARAVTDGGRK